MMKFILDVLIFFTSLGNVFPTFVFPTLYSLLHICVHSDHSENYNPLNLKNGCLIAILCTHTQKKQHVRQFFGCISHLDALIMMYLLVVLKNLIICQRCYIVSFSTGVCIITIPSQYSCVKNVLFIFLNTSLSTFPMVRQIAQ